MFLTTKAYNQSLSHHTLLHRVCVVVVRRTISLVGNGYKVVINKIFLLSQRFLVTTTNGYKWL